MEIEHFAYNGEVASVQIRLPQREHNKASTRRS